MSSPSVYDGPLPLILEGLGYRGHTPKMTHLAPLMDPLVNPRRREDRDGRIHLVWGLNSSWKFWEFPCALVEHSLSIWAVTSSGIWNVLALSYFWASFPVPLVVQAPGMTWQCPTLYSCQTILSTDVRCLPRCLGSLAQWIFLHHLLLTIKNISQRYALYEVLCVLSPCMSRTQKGSEDCLKSQILQHKQGFNILKPSELSCNRAPSENCLGHSWAMFLDLLKPFYTFLLNRNNNNRLIWFWRLGTSLGQRLTHKRWPWMFSKFPISASLWQPVTSPVTYLVVLARSIIQWVVSL